MNLNSVTVPLKGCEAPKFPPLPPGLHEDDQREEQDGRLPQLWKQCKGEISQVLFSNANLFQQVNFVKLQAEQN